MSNLKIRKLRPDPVFAVKESENLGVKVKQ